ncbi:hypothetical protein, partial [Pseudomonas sp. SIMBA_067]|uniref:hypothetical protein n=1 Tax=Pseudomonas sp. SIMBA_067 TaxID=3085807 RepID=UPI0039785864
RLTLQPETCYKARDFRSQILRDSTIKNGTTRSEISILPLSYGPEIFQYDYGFSFVEVLNPPHLANWLCGWTFSHA